LYYSWLFSSPHLSYYHDALLFSFPHVSLRKKRVYRPKQLVTKILIKLKVEVVSSCRTYPIKIRLWESGKNVVGTFGTPSFMVTTRKHGSHHPEFWISLEKEHSSALYLTSFHHGAWTFKLLLPLKGYGSCFSFGVYVSPYGFLFSSLSLSLSLSVFSFLVFMGFLLISIENL